MGEKTITVGHFQCAVSALRMSRGAYSEAKHERAIADVNVVLEAVEIDVEPEPILPDATPGEWVYQEYQARIITVKNGVDLSEEIAQYVRNNTDGKLMAGSKDLVELVCIILVQNIKGRAGTSEKWIDHTPELIDQLVKMGVSVEEFKGDE